VNVGGPLYDSKAIAGAAHGYQHAAPLAASDFSGGEATVANRLEQLGFEVTWPPIADILKFVNMRKRGTLTALAALVAGLFVAVLALPSSGVDTYPPICWARAGYEVPCNSTPSYLAAFTAAGIAAVCTWRLTRIRG
jgi:hypothetical protein